MSLRQTRRGFIASITAAGAAAYGGLPYARAGEGALETTTVRLLKFPGICIAPQYAAEELLRAEGFTDIRYIDAGPTVELSRKVGRGDADFTMEFAARTIQTID